MDNVFMCSRLWSRSPSTPFGEPSRDGTSPTNQLATLWRYPTRSRSSKRIGPWVCLTPSRNQSGEREVSGGITKAGEVNLRRALCQAATVMMNRGRSTWLRTWGAQLAQRRGRKIAMVALARRIAVILHRIWIDGSVFQPDAAPKMI